MARGRIPFFRFADQPDRTGQEDEEFQFVFDDRYWRCRCGIWNYERPDRKLRCVGCGKAAPASIRARLRR